MTIEEALGQLNELEGLEEVKAFVLDYVQLLKVYALRKARGIAAPPVTMRIAFAGNHGTGMSTVAKLLGECCREAGALSKGHLVEANHCYDLCGAYVGQTAPKTQAVIDSAKGGVLLLNDVYNLVMTSDGTQRGGFGKEALETIIRNWYAEDILIIFTGNEARMQQFLQGYGLQQKLKVLYFPDLTGEELYRIFLKEADREHYGVSDQAKERLIPYFRLTAEQGGRKNGNLRSAKILLDRIMDIKAKRFTPSTTDEELSRIGLDDLPDEVRELK